MVALRKQKQKDGCKFKTSLFYKRRLSKEQKQKQNKETNK